MASTRRTSCTTRTCCPGWRQRLRGHAHDLAALARLRGRKFILTNAPRAYARAGAGRAGHPPLVRRRVQRSRTCVMFGHLRPKPDARMFRVCWPGCGVPPARCVLVEDTLVHQKAARRVGMKHGVDAALVACRGRLRCPALQPPAALRGHPGATPGRALPAAALTCWRSVLAAK